MDDDLLIIPPALKEGDKIAIVSPAGISRAQNVYNALPVLQELGWEPYTSKHAFGRHGTYSGTDDERYADLEEALLDPEVKAILCSRGGYGAVHLLERLDKLPLRENAKWIIGFSDISALHALMSRHGIASIHGPMARHIATHSGNDADSQALFGILQGKPQTFEIAPHPLNRPGEATAPLLGGNMAVLNGLIGTPFDMFKPGTILFIEDVSEPIYKIERMMYQLKLIHHAFYLVDRFRDILYEQDCPGLEHVEGSSDQSVENGHVASEKRSCRLSRAVQRMWGYFKSLRFSLKDAEEGLRVGVIPRVGGYVSGHGAVDRGNAVAAHQRVERRDVAEPYYPFGIFAQRELVEALQKMHRAIASA